MQAEAAGVWGVTLDLFLKRSQERVNADHEPLQFSCDPTLSPQCTRLQVTAGSGALIPP